MRGVRRVRDSKGGNVKRTSRNTVVNCRLIPIELIETPSTLDHPIPVEERGMPKEFSGDTLQTVGDSLGITRERIRQVQVKATRKFIRNWKKLTGEDITESQVADLIYWVEAEDAARREAGHASA